MSGLADRHLRRLPDVRLTKVRAATSRAARASAPPGQAIVPVRRGAVVAVAADADRFELAAQMHVARAVAVSRRTQVTHAISGPTAAMCHGLKVWALPTKPTIISPAKASSLATTDYHRRARSLDEDDIVLIDGVPCTTLSRTVVDCVRELDPLPALVIADQVLAVLSGADKFDRPVSDVVAERERRRLLAIIDSLPPRSRGVARARTVLRWASPWAESPRETFVRWALLVHGWRNVVPQLEVRTDAGRAFTDLALRDGRRPDGSQRWLHVEYDGELKYHIADADRSVAAILAERDRERGLLALGDGVVRFDRRAAPNADYIAERVANALLNPTEDRQRPVLELLTPTQLRARRSANPRRRSG